MSVSRTRPDSGRWADCPQTILPGGDPLPAGQAGSDRRGQDQGNETARDRAGLAGAGPVVAADAPAGPTVAVTATSVLRHDASLQLVLSLAAGNDSEGPRALPEEWQAGVGPLAPGAHHLVVVHGIKTRARDRWLPRRSSRRAGRSGLSRHRSTRRPPWSPGRRSPPVPHLAELVVAWPGQLYLARLQRMLECNDTSRPGTSGQRDAPDERRALGVHPRPGDLAGARALDEQAEDRRVRSRRNRYELHVRWRRTFPMSDGDGLDDAHGPGLAGEELAGAIPRCPLLAPGNQHQSSDHGAPPLPVARAADRVRSAVLDEQTGR